MSQFGIWEFDEEKGLIGRPTNFPEVHLRKDKLWEVSGAGEVPVWKWPLQYARNPWFTPRVADDFNRAFFYAQSRSRETRPQKLSGDYEMRVRTIHSQTELLNDYFCCLDGEAVWISK